MYLINLIFNIKVIITFILFQQQKFGENLIKIKYTI